MDFESIDITLVKMKNYTFYKYFNNLFTLIEDSKELKYVDTRNAILLINTFNKLKECLNLYTWDTSKVKSLKSCFSHCYRITSFKGIENWIVFNVLSIERAFEWSNVKSFSILKSWKFISLKTMRRAFQYCKNLESFEGIEDWNVEECEDFSYVFMYCSSIKTLKGLEKWKVRKDANFKGMFSSCPNLVDCSAIDNWNLDKNYVDIFDRCPKIERYPIWYDKKNKNMDTFNELVIQDELDYVKYRNDYYKNKAKEEYNTVKNIILKDITFRNEGM